jgi:hypothetical protein
MTSAERVRTYFKQQGYAEHVIEGGVERLLKDWEDVCAPINENLDEYINSLDGRRILQEALDLMSDAERAQLADRIASADRKFLEWTEPAESVIGPEGLGRDGYDRNVDWWYWRVPKVRDDSWSEQMHPNSALVSDACAAALRAFCSAAQRERYAARGSFALRGIGTRTVCSTPPLCLQ